MMNKYPIRMTSFILIVILNVFIILKDILFIE